MLRDPSQALSKIVPPSLLGQMGKLGQVPGLGSVGNLGYGLAPVLESLKSGVIGETLSKFGNQLGIIGPALNLEAKAEPIHETAKSNEVEIQGSAVNPNIPVAQGVPVQTIPASPIFRQNAAFQKAIDATNPLNRFSPPPGQFQLQQSNRGPTRQAAAQQQRQAPLVMVPSQPRG
jgi:hypothetical protein